MKTVAVFFDDPGYDDYPFDDDYYVQAYHQMAKILQEKGGTLVIVRGQDSYLGDNRFTHCWRFDGETFRREDGPVDVDIIYDKGYFKNDAAATLLNDAEMNEICTDKFKTYQLFKEFSPMTFLIHDKKELDEKLALFNDIVVAKIPDSEGGEGVFIDTPDVIREKVTVFPYILQEFMDTSGGIPGLVDGMHDLRMVGINGTIVVSYVRAPGKGKKVSNVSQGGTQIDFPLSELPPDAVDFFKKVDAMFSRFPRRVYSADCGRMKDGSWKVIELNSKPGLTQASTNADHRRFVELLCDALLS